MFTDEFVAWFSRKENQAGEMWQNIAKGILPQGVDIRDDRVVELMQMANRDLAHLCQKCGQPWPETETVGASGLVCGNCEKGA